MARIYPSFAKRTSIYYHVIRIVRPFGLQKEYLGGQIGQPQDNKGLGAL